MTGTLVGSKQRVVAVDRCGDAGPDALAVVAALDQGLAARERVFHALAFTVVEDGGPAAFTAGHGLVVCILGETVCEAVADEDGFEVDVSLLVGQDL